MSLAGRSARAAQVAIAVSGAAVERTPRRRAQRLDDCGILGGVGGKQVDGEALGLGAAGLQQLSCPAVGGRFAAPGSSAQDGASHQRVNEAQRTSGGDHAGGRERIGGLGSGVGLQLRELGGIGERDIVAQDRDRTRQLEAESARRASRTSTARWIVAGATSRTCAASAAVPALASAASSTSSSRSMNGLPALVSWQAEQNSSSASAKALAHQLGDRVLAELVGPGSRSRRGRRRARGRSSASPSAGRPRPRAPRAGPRDGNEKAQEPQRGRVRPVGVIERQQRRLGLTSSRSANRAR